MANGLIQEIIAAAHEYERMEKRLEELTREVESEPPRYNTCSICEYQAGERVCLHPFANKYTTSLYVCMTCKESGVLDKYAAFLESINRKGDGE